MKKLTQQMDLDLKEIVGFGIISGLSMKNGARNTEWTLKTMNFDITTDIGKHFYNEVSKNFGLQTQSLIGNSIVAVESELRERIAREIEQIDLGTSSQINGLGMRMLAAEVARGRK